MTYNPNDPNNLNDRNYTAGSRRAAANDSSYMGWIIGGLVALAVILGIVFLLPMNNSNTASNNTNETTASSPARPAVPPASTTGSGATSPKPAAPTAPASSR